MYDCRKQGGSICANLSPTESCTVPLNSDCSKYKNIDDCHRDKCNDISIEKLNGKTFFLKNSLNQYLFRNDLVYDNCSSNVNKTVLDCLRKFVTFTTNHIETSPRCNWIIQKKDGKILFKSWKNDYLGEFIKSNSNGFDVFFITNNSIKIKINGLYLNANTLTLSNLDEQSNIWTLEEVSKNQISNVNNNSNMVKGTFDLKNIKVGGKIEIGGPTNTYTVKKIIPRYKIISDDHKSKMSDTIKIKDDAHVVDVLHHIDDCNQCGKKFCTKTHSNYFYSENDKSLINDNDVSSNSLKTICDKNGNYFNVSNTDADTLESGTYALLDPTGKTCGLFSNKIHCDYNRAINSNERIKLEKIEGGKYKIKSDHTGSYSHKNEECEDTPKGFKCRDKKTYCAIQNYQVKKITHSLDEAQKALPRKGWWDNRQMIATFDKNNNPIDPHNIFGQVPKTWNNSNGNSSMFWANYPDIHKMTDICAPAVKNFNSNPSANTKFTIEKQNDNTYAIKSDRNNKYCSYKDVDNAANCIDSGNVYNTECMPGYLLRPQFNNGVGKGYQTYWACGKKYHRRNHKREYVSDGGCNPICVPREQCAQKNLVCDSDSVGKNEKFNFVNLNNMDFNKCRTVCCKKNVTTSKDLKINKSEPNVENSYIIGKPLSTWGCENYNKFNQGIVSNSNTNDLYVLEDKSSTNSDLLHKAININGKKATIIGFGEKKSNTTKAPASTTTTRVVTPS